MNSDEVKHEPVSKGNDKDDKEVCCMCLDPLHIIHTTSGRPRLLLKFKECVIRCTGKLVSTHGKKLADSPRASHTRRKITSVQFAALLSIVTKAPSKSFPNGFLRGIRPLKASPSLTSWRTMCFRLTPSKMSRAWCAKRWGYLQHMYGGSSMVANNSGQPIQHWPN